MPSCRRVIPTRRLPRARLGIGVCVPVRPSAKPTVHVLRPSAAKCPRGERPAGRRPRQRPPGGARGSGPRQRKAPAGEAVSYSTPDSRFCPTPTIRFSEIVDRYKSVTTTTENVWPNSEIAPKESRRWENETDSKYSYLTTWLSNGMPIIHSQNLRDMLLLRRHVSVVTEITRPSAILRSCLLHSRRNDVTDDVTEAQPHEAQGLEPSDLRQLRSQQRLLVATRHALILLKP